LDVLRSQGAAQPTPSPELETEFQEFVSTALGKSLPFFGYDLFQNVPTTFAPLDRVEVPSDYVIGPQDDLVIHGWGQINVNYRAVVDRSGAIYIPTVGSINVAGVRYSELHDYLQSEFGKTYKNFQLSVNLGRLRSIQVFVVGQARRQGSYTISSLSTLVDALFASGGPSKHGSMRTIQLKRDGKVITTFDLYDLIANGDKTKDAKLASGDVIYIPPMGPQVAMAGSVNTPAIFELKDRTTLGEMIALAGGLASTAAGERVLVERIEDHRIRKADEFDLTEQGLVRELHDGDVIRFLHISPKFENAVTLRGNVAVPGRYPWHQGMHVSDLIPSRAFLVTDQYWNMQNKLAVNAQSTGLGVKQAQLKNDVKRLSSEINWEYADIQRFNAQDLTPSLVVFNLGKAIEGDSEQNLELQPNDVVTIFAQNDIQGPTAERAKFVHLEGELKKAGVYQVLPGETLRQLVNRIGGFTPQAYLFGSEFTRESTRVDQQTRLNQYANNLDQSLARSTAAASFISDATSAEDEKANLAEAKNTVDKVKGLQATGRIVLELKPSAKGVDVLPDLPLEDGDRLLVPFRPATVNVIGAVYNSSAFIYKPEKNVSDYLRLAGGPTKSGDKGREFVIRADGSTVSRQQHSVLISRSFNALRVMPGDTIIVPEKLDRGATLRFLKDFTAILAQVGVGAAGIRAVFP